MKCLEERSSDEVTVGLKEYQSAALVLEICREFHLDVEDALSSHPIGEMESIQLSIGEGNAEKRLLVTSHNQIDLLKRVKKNRWFSEDGFSSGERKRRFEYVLTKLGITLEERHYKRSAI